MNLVKLRKEDKGIAALYFDLDTNTEYRTAIKNEELLQFVSIVNMTGGEKTFYDDAAIALVSYLEAEIAKKAYNQ